MSSIKIGVVLPSRGLIFSRTAEELLNNLQGYDYDLFFAHGLPIPLCFETPLKQALNGSYSHIFILEDDMILPDSTLDSMLIADVPVAVCDYPVSAEGQGVVFSNKEGEILFAGTGCMLIKRAVFDKLKKPYFRSDIGWGVANYGKFIRFIAQDHSGITGYGLQDVTFGMKLYKARIPISVIGNIGQRKLIRLGRAGSNEGAHQIEEWTKIKPDFLLKKFRKLPKVELGKLITVMASDGKEITVHPTHARKLIKKGLASAIKQRSVGIDYGDYII